MTTSLPDLPLRSLATAEEQTTTEVARGRKTIIDFWTTQGKRCLDDLDNLDELSQDPEFSDVQFVSICCDHLDGAREIIEKKDDLRWPRIHHFFMESQDAESCKEALGFRSVPFYVLLNNTGEIEQMGGCKQLSLVPSAQR